MTLRAFVSAISTYFFPWEKQENLVDEKREEKLKFAEVPFDILSKRNLKKGERACVSTGAVSIALAEDLKLRGHQLDISDGELLIVSVS